MTITISKDIKDYKDSFCGGGNANSGLSYKWFSKDFKD